MLVFETRPVSSMTLGAITQEQLLSSGWSLSLRTERVLLGSGVAGCSPVAVWIIREVLCEGREDRENSHYYEPRLHGLIPKSLEIFPPIPWIS